MGLKHHPKVITNGMIIYYDFANTRSYSGSGITINNLFSGYGCTTVNGPAFSSDNLGYLIFDGTNDYGQFSLPNLTSWSFSFWIYNHTVPVTEKQLLSTYFDYTGLSMVNSKYHIWNGSSNSGNAAIAQSTWTNVVFTNTGFSSSSIYINGALDRTFGTGNQIASGDAQLLAINGTQRNHQANLGLFMAYNRALSLTEIFQNYNATKRRYGK